MWVGCLVKLTIPYEHKFDGAKGMIINRVDADDYSEGHYFQVQLFDGHIIIALPHEIEMLRDELEISI